MKKKPPPSERFHIPNNEEGREFIRLMRKYASAGTRIRLRGRGPRKHPERNYRQSLPQKYATHFGVYVDKDKAHYKEMTLKQWQDAMTEVIQLRDEAQAGRARITELAVERYRKLGQEVEQSETVSQILDSIWNARRRIRLN